MFLVLESQDDVKLIVNTSHIMHAFPSDKEPDCTIIRLTDGKPIMVDISLDDLITTLNQLNDLQTVG